MWKCIISHCGESLHLKQRQRTSQMKYEVSYTVFHGIYFQSQCSGRWKLAFLGLWLCRKGEQNAGKFRCGGVRWYYSWYVKRNTRHMQLKHLLPQNENGPPSAHCGRPHETTSTQKPVTKKKKKSWMPEHQPWHTTLDSALLSTETNTSTEVLAFRLFWSSLEMFMLL